MKKNQRMIAKKNEIQEKEKIKMKGKVDEKVKRSIKKIIKNEGKTRKNFWDEEFSFTVGLTSLSLLLLSQCFSCSAPTSQPGFLQVSVNLGNCQEI